MFIQQLVHFLVGITIIVKSSEFVFGVVPVNSMVLFLFCYQKEMCENRFLIEKVYNCDDVYNFSCFIKLNYVCVSAFVCPLDLILDRDQSVIDIILI